MNLKKSYDAYSMRMKKNNINIALAVSQKLTKKMKPKKIIKNPYKQVSRKLNVNVKNLKKSSFPNKIINLK